MGYVIVGISQFPADARAFDPCAIVAVYISLAISMDSVNSLGARFAAVTLDCGEEFADVDDTSFPKRSATARERVVYRSVHALDGYRALRWIPGSDSAPGIVRCDYRRPSGDRSASTLSATGASARCSIR
jgi:hypothetical protein